MVSNFRAPFFRVPFRAAAGLLLCPALVHAQNAAPSLHVITKPTAPPAAAKPALPVSKDPKDWLARFAKVPAAKGMDAKTYADFDGLDPDSAYHIYSETFLQIKNPLVRRVVFRIVLAKTKAPDVVERDPARLLSVFDSALNDSDPVVRKSAFEGVSPLLLRSFATHAQWAAWRKASASKSLAQLLREDCDALAAAFSTATYERKLEIFNLMGRAAFQEGYATESANGKTTRALKATGLNALRRAAVQDSGLFDALTMPLRGPADDLAGRSLNFVRCYRPDAAQIQRIEPGLKQQMEARYSAPESQVSGSLELLFQCRGGWAMPLLIKVAQNNYLTGGSRAIFSLLTKSQDVRALPLLIDLLPTTIGQESVQLKAAIAKLLIKPEPADVLAKRDASGWRDWWQKNKSDYPADAQTLTLGPLKTGAEAVIVRLENNTQRFGLDGTAMQQFQALDTEARYRVLQGVWGVEMNYYAKQQLLYTFANSEDPPDPKDPKHTPKGNPRLLDALYLGMTDSDGDVQQAAAQIIFQKTMQSFPDAASFLLWRKKSVGRPLKELELEGAKAFVARFAAASEGDRADLLTKLMQSGIQAGSKIEIKDGKTVRTVIVGDDAAAKRKILVDGGLIAQATEMLQSRNETAAGAAANFLEQFQPENADLPKIEEGMRRVYTRWVTQSETQYRPQYSFMLLFHGAWVGDLLTQAAQNSSASPFYRSQGPLPEMMQSDDKRTLPVLISALDAQPKAQQPPVLQRLAKVTGVKFDASQDSAFWRKWWDANKAALPEEARVMKIAVAKSPKDVLLEKIVKSKEGFDYEVYYQYEMADAETQWVVLTEGWKKITNTQLKSYLFSITFSAIDSPNTKLKPGVAERRELDLLALAISDADENIRQEASGVLYNFAVRDIKDAAAFTAWRKEIGDKPIVEVVKQGTRDALTRLTKADAKTLPKMLASMQRIDWGARYRAFNASDDAPVATGLSGARRKIAIEMKLPDTLARLLHSDQTPEVNQNALVLLHAFMPGRAVFSRVEQDAARILPLLARKKADNDYMTMSLLTPYRGKWATDLLLETAKKRYMSNPYGICYTLSVSKSPRVIPTLIAIMEDEDGESYMRYTVAQGLARLTHTTENINHNGAWWRDWWQKNKAHLPEEARNEPIPDLQLGNRYAKTFSIKRGRQLETIAHDSHRAYWRLSSGLLISEKKKKAPKAGVKPAAPVLASNKPAASEPAGIPLADRPGLLVVLGDGDTDIALQAGYWQDVAGRGFGGKYLVALVSPPRWREKQTALWLTRKNHAEVPEAAFTTETLAADVARDMESKYPINPSRVFLIGAGMGGPAAYACSLEARTPFHGFLLLQSVFRSAQLPPLANAKNRRYYLLNSRDDKRVPFFAATLAQNTLRAQGAAVKLSRATPNPDADQSATWEETTDGVKWLEAER